MLAIKRLSGVIPEVNLRECASHIPLPSANKSAHSGFETQRRHHQKSKHVYQWPHKRTWVHQHFFEKKKYLDSLIREARNQETQNGLQPLLFRYESRVDPDAPNKIIDAKRRQALKSKI